MRRDREIGGIDQVMQALPDRWRQELEPEVMAGGGQDQQADQREYPKEFKGKARDLPKTRIGIEQTHIFVGAGKVEVPVQDVARMGDRDKGGHHPEMTSIVKQGQEPSIEPCGRTDAQDHRQHHERTGPKGAGIVDLRVDGAFVAQNLRRDIQEDPQKQGDACEHDGVVEPLVVVPLNGGVFDAHWFAPSLSWTGATSAGHSCRTDRPSATMTTMARLIRIAAVPCAARTGR
mmetsp:Transcript_24127/g.44832  ORF Transcript_24127/g.44832 Transcript_24127/m.44832 type:complete len:232 (-) Transcript_24127:6087-6782(-)